MVFSAMARAIIGQLSYYGSWQWSIPRVPIIAQNHEWTSLAVHDRGSGKLERTRGCS